MNYLKSLIYPPRCASCGALIDRTEESTALCEKCTEIWNFQKEGICKICNRYTEDCTCNPVYNQTHIVQRYCYLLPHRKGRPTCYTELNHGDFTRRILNALKYDRNGNLTDFIANQLTVLIKNKIGEDFIIAYAPREKTEKLYYGYDHAKAVAAKVAKNLNCPFFKGIRRSFMTKIQKGLSNDSRGKNAFYSYHIASSDKKFINDRLIILIDDLVTTGATSTAIAAMLKRNGARGVICVTLAKTELKDTGATHSTHQKEHFS